MNKNFKFIANCIIMQKADCGLNISGSCFWDNEVDGTVTVKWDAPTLICIVNVFGCSLWFFSLLWLTISSFSKSRRCNRQILSTSYKLQFLLLISVSHRVFGALKVKVNSVRSDGGVYFPNSKILPSIFGLFCCSFLFFYVAIGIGFEWEGRSPLFFFIACDRSKVRRLFWSKSPVKGRVFFWEEVALW